MLLGAAEWVVEPASVSAYEYAGAISKSSPVCQLLGAMSPTMPDFREIYRRTSDVYEEHAAAWDEQRPRVFFEKDWIDRFVDGLPSGGRVLDVGCGAGLPISRYLIEQGFEVTGVDSSPKMIEISRSRMAEATWLVMDMRNLTLTTRFDGIVSWDAFFHLTPNEQRSTIRRFCRHLDPGGSMLLTIGDQAGEVLGWVNGERVYHSSLDPSEYRETLEAAGFENVELSLRDARCGEHSILVASNYQGHE